MKKRLLFIVNTMEFFLSHRLPIARAAQKAGYEIHVATGTNYGHQHLKLYGFKHYLLPLSRSGKNLLRETWTTIFIIRLIRQIRPDIVHLVTIKPVLYGGLAARICKVPCVAAISGLGSVFMAQTIAERALRFFVARFYRLALGYKKLRIIFQNADDRKIITSLCDLPFEKSILIPGSGVDLTEYKYYPEPESPIKVIFAGRLLKDKGIREFVRAASILSEQGIDALFMVAGAEDNGNPATIRSEILEQWRTEGRVEFLEQRNDIAKLFRDSHIVVLPSYREGLPKVLIEAAACGRAVVTTDVPGCRDAIIPDETGILVPHRNALALAETIKKLIYNPELRRAMGKAGRELAERKFAINYVVDAHMNLYDELDKMYGVK